MKVDELLSVCRLEAAVSNRINVVNNDERIIGGVSRCTAVWQKTRSMYKPLTVAATERLQRLHRGET